jgi:deoxyadenosine/deoxycytidine kinase
MKNYICIEGNIGAGKSTLAKLISKDLGFHYLPEEFEENYLLPLFYKEPQQFAFPLEFSFLLDRFRQLCIWKEKLQNQPVVSDYYFEKCLYFAKINLNATDYALFESQYNKLKLSTENLQQNIKNRNRDYENEIENSYLEKLNTIYQEKSSKSSDIKCISFTLSNNDSDTYERIFLELSQLIKHGTPSQNLEIQL